METTNDYKWFTEPEVQTPWLVDGLIPANGYSAVVGKPKAGKSTIIRNLIVAVVKGGERLEFDEAAVRTALKSEVVDLEVTLGVGNASATAYGCDLTNGYIEENAAYYSS